MAKRALSPVDQVDRADREDEHRQPQLHGERAAICGVDQARQARHMKEDAVHPGDDDDRYNDGRNLGEPAHGTNQHLLPRFGGHGAKRTQQEQREPEHTSHPH